MSQYQPYYQDDFDEPGREDLPYADELAPGPPRTSGMALASLICGVMFCIPLIPSLFATIFGVIGLRETRHRVVSGRGFAVTGLILGLVGTGGWMLIGSAAYLLWTQVIGEMKSANTAASAFVRELSEGKIDAASARCLPGVDKAQLSAAGEAMKKWGPFNSLEGDMRPTPGRFEGTFRWDFDGTAVFSRGECTVSLRMSKDGTNYRVERFDWKPGG